MLLGTNLQIQRWFNHTDALLDISKVGFIESGLAWVNHTAAGVMALDSDNYLTDVSSGAVARRPMISRDGGVSSVMQGHELDIQWIGTVEVALGWYSDGVPGAFNSSTFQFNYDDTGRGDGDALTLWVRNGALSDVSVVRTSDRTAYAAGKRFTPEHAANSRVINSHVSRFMDWNETNQSLDVDWADRNTGSNADYYQTPYEQQIAYANETNTHPWFCIPVRATNAYCTALAQLIQASLKPHLKAYIEYANEVWNTANVFNTGTMWTQYLDVAPVTASIVIANGASTGYFEVLGGHGLSANDELKMFNTEYGDSANSGDTWPISLGYSMYVLAIDADTFTLSESPGGAEYDWSNIGAIANTATVIYKRVADAVNTNWNQNYMTRSLGIWAAMDAVLGADRVIAVCGSFSEIPSNTTDRLAIDTGDRTDVVAIAPYFGGGYEPYNNTGDTVDQIRDTLLAEIAGNLTTKVAGHKAVCDANGCALVLYEWGCHVIDQVSDVDQSTANINAYYGSSQEGEVYVAAINMFNAQDVALACNFIDIDPIKNGFSWGAKESLASPDTSIRQSVLAAAGKESDATGVSSLYSIGHSMIGHETPRILDFISTDAGQGGTWGYQWIVGSSLQNNIENPGGSFTKDADTDHWDVHLAAGYDAVRLAEVTDVAYLPKSEPDTQGGVWPALEYGAPVAAVSTLYDAALAGRATCDVWLDELWQYRQIAPDFNQGSVYYADENEWITAMRTNLFAEWHSLRDLVAATGRTARMIFSGQAVCDLWEEIEVSNVSGITSIRDILENDGYEIHLTNLGHYFMSCLVYSYIYGRSPQGRAFSGIADGDGGTYTAPTAQQAADFQRIAFDSYIKNREHEPYSLLSEAVVVPNDNPTVEASIPDQILRRGFVDFVIDCAPFFQDTETSDANLIYSASGNTGCGISFSGSAATISSIKRFGGVFSVEFKATDEQGAEVTQDVLFKIGEFDFTFTAAQYTDVWADTFTGYKSSVVGGLVFYGGNVAEVDPLAVGAMIGGPQLYGNDLLAIQINDVFSPAWRVVFSDPSAMVSPDFFTSITVDGATHLLEALQNSPLLFRQALGVTTLRLDTVVPESIFTDNAPLVGDHIVKLLTKPQKPEFPSATASVNIAENSTTLVTDAALADGVKTYSLGGTDAVLFNMPDPATGVFSPVVEFDYEPVGATYSVQKIVTTPDGSDTQDITITVVDVNEAPTVDNPIPDQAAAESTAFSFQFSATAFGDPEGDTLTYSATMGDDSPLVAGLIFTPATRTFDWTPTNGDIGTHSVKVTAIDVAGSNTPVSDVFDIVVGVASIAPDLGGNKLFNWLEETNFSEDLTVVAGSLPATYSIANRLVNDDEDFFTLDPNTAVITSDATYDYEVDGPRTFLFWLTASDGVNPDDVVELNIVRANDFEVTISSPGPLVLSYPFGSGGISKTDQRILDWVALFVASDASVVTSNVDARPTPITEATVSINNPLLFNAGDSLGTTGLLVVTEDAEIITPPAFFANESPYQAIEQQAFAMMVNVTNNYDSISLIGDDSALFNGVAGSLSNGWIPVFVYFNTVPDYEAGKLVYNFTIQASNAAGDTDFPVVIDLINKDGEPEITGYLSSIAGAYYGEQSGLDRSKIAVVYNTFASAAADSEEVADYYIAQRSLNSALKIGFDFQADGSAEYKSGGDYKAGFLYTDIIVPLAQFCRDNEVQGIIVSQGVPQNLTVTHSAPVTYAETGQGGTSGILAACHYFVEAGNVAIFNTGHFSAPDVSGLGDFRNDITMSELESSMTTLWYDDSEIQGVDIIGPSQEVHKANPVDYTLAARSNVGSDPTDRYNLMPNGRLGYGTDGGWVDTVENTKRCIDDAIAVESEGWAANKDKQLNAMASVRNSNLNVQETMIVAHRLRAEGWAVKASLRDGAGNAGLSDYFEDQALYQSSGINSSSSAIDVLDAFGVIYDDYVVDDSDPNDILFLTSGQDNFISFGTSLNNVTTGNWTASFNWLRGSLHMHSTSHPTMTLVDAMAAGACGGIGGRPEPGGDQTGFIPFVMLALVRGLSLMEGHFEFQQSRFTAHSFAAGDPLYAPYSKLAVVSEPAATGLFGRSAALKTHRQIGGMWSEVDDT
jgi:hypothetical protein